MRLSLITVLSTALLASAQLPTTRPRLFGNLFKKPSATLSVIAPAITSAPAASAVPDGHGDHGDHGGHGGHGGTGAVTEPETTIPDGFFIEPDLNPDKIVTPGARIVDQLLGPYTIKAGAAKNFFETNVKMPCKNCWVTAAQGTLEYKDGSEANINTGVCRLHSPFRTRLLFLFHLILRCRPGFIIWS